MAEIVIAVASKVAEDLVAPVGRQCGYVIFTNSYVGQLKEELEKLEDVRVGVRRSVDHADNNMREIKREVNRWKNDAETAADKARSVLDNYGRAKKTCFYGWLPNPKGRYCLGRDARKTAQAIQKLIQDCQFETVCYESGPPGRVDGAAEVNSSTCDGGDTIQELIPLGQFENPLPGLVGCAPDMNLSAGGAGDTITDSRASIFQDIMKALDDEKLQVIGVYGPGGVGKTTLLEEIEKKLREKGRPFHMIVKAKVLQIPVLKKIQDEIADALKLDLNGMQTESYRGKRLLERLQKNPSEKVLIILDDLWEELDLNAVGIPSGDTSGKCKLLLASRFKDVLEHKMRADRTFLLEGLNYDEVFRLFEKTVGDRLKDEEELTPIAAQVVKKLAGLPLLINSVACTLKCSRLSAWSNALIKIDDSSIESIVQLSYEHLKREETRSLFLLCGLIGGTIPVELLLVLGMGLGLFEPYDKTIKDSRDRLNTMLDSLRSICLLQEGDDDEENVTIHDLYSEVVVSTPFGSQNSLMMNRNYGFWSKEKLENCWAIYLADVDKYRPDKLRKCQFPNLKLLMLSQPKNWSWMQELEDEEGDCSELPDFECMKKLRVLYFCSMRIARLPSSIKFLGNLLSLYLDYCSVEDVAILGELEALEILSFEGSTISRLPEEIGKLTNMRLLNLNHCCSLKIIVPGALKGLINLEELHMKKSFDPWMGKHEKPLELCVAGLAGLVELKSLTKLASLEISIYDPIILLEDVDLPFENLDKFWINIGDDEEMECEGLTTMKLNLPGCSSILSKKGVAKNLQKTQCLYLSNLGEFEESPCELCTQGFQGVKYLDIKDSPSIKYIIDSSNAYSSSDVPLIVFGKLESFFLKNLINLEKICHGPIALECFNKLKVVRVRQCGKLKYLWCLSDVQRLVQLEEIEVWNCDSMQSIVAHDAGEDIVSANNRVELRNVRCLELCELPNMTSFCTKAEITSKDTPIQVSLPQLEFLMMIGLLGLEEILYSERSLKYSNLRSLDIHDSKSTSKSILKLDWILKLPNLESVEIISSSAEVVFDLEELEVTEDVKILSRLTQLKLNQLPNLQRICKQDVKLQEVSILRNLTHLYIYETGLSFLFSVSVAKCFREIRKIIVADCPKMKAVIVDEGGNEGTYDIIEFPLLEFLSIQECRMEKFFSYPCGKKEPVTTNSDLQDANSDSFFDQKVTIPNITVLKISGLQCKELWNDQIPTDSFQKLESLQVENCDNLQRIGPPQMWKVLQRCLKNLKVISCPMIKIIYEGHGLDTEAGELRMLVLHGLKNLRHIWQSNSLPNIPFPNVREVEVMRCPCLEMVFPTFTAKFLRQIKELVVESCEDMELIAGHKKWEEATGTTITFSKLTVLRLFELPKFKSFLPKKYSLKFPCSEDFPSLQVLRIESCGAEPDQVLGDWYRHQKERDCRLYP